MVCQAKLVLTVAAQDVDYTWRKAGFVDERCHLRRLQCVLARCFGLYLLLAERLTVRGAFSELFNTIVQPDATAGATFMPNISSGTLSTKSAKAHTT